MGKCVFCGSLSNNTKNATLHKFPRDEQLCKEWLRLIGLEGLSIKSSSFLCSDHFTQDCFVVHFNNRKRLKPGTVPTILKKEARFQEQWDVSVETNCRDKAQDVAVISGNENYEPQRNVLIEVNSTDNDDVGPPSIIEQVPATSIIINCSDSPTTSKGIFSPEKCFSLPSTQNNTTPMKEKYKTRTVFHDHHYEDTPHSTRKKLNNLRTKLNSAMKENKILKQTVGRLKKKVHSLQDVVKELKQKKFLPDSAYYCLSAHEDISMELFNRMIKNRKNRGMMCKKLIVLLLGS